MYGRRRSKRINQEMSSEELHDLVTPTDSKFSALDPLGRVDWQIKKQTCSESNDNEKIKRLLTYNKLNKLSDEAEELSDLSLEIGPNVKIRGHFMRGI
ncbi:hypothetical protein AVEN_261733-1 [Araneus ventricosus]|uniref:Uncharacterized protein n=1 Tax=Araneus ventricosus TaxID=182803 RepID=A0A4Y2E7H5_ARAVE|nr:hypothetical protein AVEN_261733-1 [Araneus ventricosus]